MSTKMIDAALTRFAAVAPDGFGDGLMIEKARAELAALRSALRNLREVAFDGPSEVKGAPGGESLWDWRQRIDRETAWVNEESAKEAGK